MLKSVSSTNTIGVGSAAIRAAIENNISVGGVICQGYPNDSRIQTEFFSLCNNLSTARLHNCFICDGTLLMYNLYNISDDLMNIVERARHIKKPIFIQYLNEFNHTHDNTIAGILNFINANAISTLNVVGSKETKEYMNTHKLSYIILNGVFKKLKQMEG